MESFGAYGQRRGTNWSGSPTSGEMTTINDTTRKGFTEHEMLDSTELVHMNGRVFDPVIGRFVSADPIEDCGLGTQGWNRYGYVGNRTLTFKDPSGFSHFSDEDPNPCLRLAYVFGNSSLDFEACMMSYFSGPTVADVLGPPDPNGSDTSEPETQCDPSDEQLKSDLCRPEPWMAPIRTQVTKDWSEWIGEAKAREELRIVDTNTRIDVGLTVRRGARRTAFDRSRCRTGGGYSSSVVGGHIWNETALPEHRHFPNHGLRLPTDARLPTGRRCDKELWGSSISIQCPSR
jgi:RHS repeat-associated protein